MKRILPILTAMALFALPLRAEEGYHWFHHLHATTDNVRTLCPDADGRIWLGTTRGLFRYGDFPDGARYDLFPDIYRQGINEVSPFLDGRLLVRTRDGVLTVYDPVENRAVPLEQYLENWGLAGWTAGWDVKVLVDDGAAVWLWRDRQVYRKGPSDPQAVLLTETPDPILSFHADGDAFCLLTEFGIGVYSASRPRETVLVPHGLEFHRSGIWSVLDGRGPAGRPGPCGPAGQPMDI